MRFLCAAFAAAFLVSTPVLAEQEASSDAGLRAVFDMLRGGGNVLVLRHANSPGGQAVPVGMTPGCILQAGRGLDAEGFYQARHIGEWLKKEGVPVLKAYTSDMCRAWDTARLAAGGAEVTAHPAQKTTDPEAIAAFDLENHARMPIVQLSGGEAHRAHLARTLAQLWAAQRLGAAGFLLIDEPTASLDMAHQRAVLDAARGAAADGAGVQLLHLQRTTARAVVRAGGVVDFGLRVERHRILMGRPLRHSIGCVLRTM